VDWQRIHIMTCCEQIHNRLIKLYFQKSS